MIIVLGLAIGYRPDGGPAGVLGALGLVIVFSFGLSWVFTALGLVMRSPNATMNAGFMTIFPLTFLSNVYVEPETLPDGLRQFVEANPISHLVTACRSLMNGSADSGEIVYVLVASALLTAVFAPITNHLYKTKGCERA